MLGVMGRGASSTVYRARQVDFDRLVALKVLNVDVSDRRAQKRFQRERTLNGRLSNHPNVVTVLDSGFVADRFPYLSMELFDEGSLSDRLKSDGPFDVQLVLHVGVRIAGALESAHQIGVLHRDVKPQNILLSRYGEPALADFGIAAILEEMEQSLTHSLTPVHAAPETLEGSEPTPLTDVYSLGSTLFTLLAGRAPFAGPPGEGILAQLLRITTSDLPPMPRSDVHDRLMALLRSSMAKRPEARPPGAAAVGQALQKIQAELNLAVTPLPVASERGLTATVPVERPAQSHGYHTHQPAASAPGSPAPVRCTPVPVVDDDNAETIDGTAPGDGPDRTERPSPTPANVAASPLRRAPTPQTPTDTPVPAEPFDDGNATITRPTESHTVIGRQRHPDQVVERERRSWKVTALAAIIPAAAVSAGFLVYRNLSADPAGGENPQPTPVPVTTTPQPSTAAPTTAAAPTIQAPTVVAGPLPPPGSTTEPVVAPSLPVDLVQYAPERIWVTYDRNGAFLSWSDPPTERRVPFSIVYAVSGQPVQRIDRQGTQAFETSTAIAGVTPTDDVCFVVTVVVDPATSPHRVSSQLCQNAGRAELREPPVVTLTTSFAPTSSVP